MEFKTLLFDKLDGVATITLNRPKTFNAINDELIAELDAVMDAIIADPEIRAVIITGGEKAFAAGGDIQFMSTADMLQAQKFVENIKVTFDKIYNLDRPVIAAISGLALGGGSELALTCDIRIAAEGSIIGQPEINLGIIPGAGGTQRLTRVVGPGWARYLVMTGKNIDADTALRIGLVTAVVPKDQLMNEARKLAGILSSKSPTAMKAAKCCLNLGQDVDLNSGLNFELKTWAGLFATEDQKEGMKAFLEKRQPVYTGK
ncbi:MAG TPA: enoyl-CoA hydratase-related protein [Syntrophomonadaceae bacterium]|nr:enoyl-CoA hydratase-related protein [Syntrophomonadaceae bacterium]